MLPSSLIYERQECCGGAVVAEVSCCSGRECTYVRMRCMYTSVGVRECVHVARA